MKQWLSNFVQRRLFSEGDGLGYFVGSLVVIAVLGTYGFALWASFKYARWIIYAAWAWITLMLLVDKYNDEHMTVKGMLYWGIFLAAIIAMIATAKPIPGDPPWHGGW